VLVIVPACLSALARVAAVFAGGLRAAAVPGVVTALLGVLAWGLWRARRWAWYVTFTAFTVLCVLALSGVAVFVAAPGGHGCHDSAWEGCAIAMGVVLAAASLALGAAARAVYGDRRRVL
jgi:hypothetical protein